MRIWLRRTHLVLSLAAGLWLAAMALAGSLLVFGDALDRTLHPELFAVRLSKRVPLDGVLAAAEAAGGGRATRVRLAGASTPVHEVWIDCDDCRRVWVDPSTARVNGIRSAHGTTRTFLHELHRRMLLRGAGDVAVLIGGIVLLVITATGVVLGWRGGLRIRSVSFYELHRVGGLLVAPLLFVSAATGIYFVQAGLRAKTPAQTSTAPARVSLDGAVELARAEFPAASATWVTITPKEVVVRFRQQPEKHPNGRTFVRIDAARGTIVGRVDALAVPPSQRFLDRLYPLHIGATGGLVHRLVLVLAGGTPAAFLATGVVLWLRRTRRRRSITSRRYVPATETFSNTSVGVRCEE
jgi:uncharacterized iron-regulated membrane protein